MGFLWVRVILQFSTLKAHGDSIKPGAITVSGRIAYAVPESPAAVVLMGCGVDKFAVDMTDINGVKPYRLINVCRSKADKALADLQRVRTLVPCSRFAA